MKVFLCLHFPKKSAFLSGGDRQEYFLKRGVGYFKFFIHVFPDLLLTFNQFFNLFLSVSIGSFGMNIAFHLLNDKEDFVWNRFKFEDKPNLLLK